MELKYILGGGGLILALYYLLGFLYYNVVVPKEQQTPVPDENAPPPAVQPPTTTEEGAGTGSTTTEVSDEPRASDIDTNGQDYHNQFHTSDYLGPDGETVDDTEAYIYRNLSNQINALSDDQRKGALQSFATKFLGWGGGALYKQGVVSVEPQAPILVEDEGEDVPETTDPEKATTTDTSSATSEMDQKVQDANYWTKVGLCNTLDDYNAQLQELQSKIGQEGVRVNPDSITDLQDKIAYTQSLLDEYGGTC